MESERSDATDGFPDVYVICLASAFDKRGAKTIEFLQTRLFSNVSSSSNGATVKRFNAITPADFQVEDVVSVAQLAIIRGRAPRITHTDMSNTNQVACYLSHEALWKVCVDAGKPIVVVEDDAQPSNVASRIASARRIKKLSRTSSSASKKAGESASASASASTSASKSKRTSFIKGKIEGNSAQVEETPLVVLLQHGPQYESRSICLKSGTESAYASSQVCYPRVSSFFGAGMYYLTPAAAQLLLKHSAPAAMHVDHFMSTCIASYDLVVYSMPGAADQSGSESTLGHSSIWLIVTERQKLFIILLLILSFCLLVWAVSSTVVGQRRHRQLKQHLQQHLQQQ